MGRRVVGRRPRSCAQCRRPATHVPRQRATMRASLRRRIVLVTVLVCAAGGWATAQAPAAYAAASLTQSINAALGRCGMLGSGTSVLVWDTDSGRVVYSRLPYALRVPASNEKLVTSATALARWGADHCFTTSAMAGAAADADGVLRGDLWLHGGGDPLLTASGLKRLASAVRAAGVRSVTGRIVGDESLFDQARSVGSWQAGDSAYCGSLSALAVNEGWAGGAQPALAAARLFRAALAGAGVKVAGQAASGRAPDGAVTVAQLESPPLWRILMKMNKPSDNFIAEMLTKGLGRDFAGSGSTRAGLSVESAFLRSSGFTSRDFVLRDGSGLSPQDRLSTSTITRLLLLMDDRFDFQSYWGSLAIAGCDGTLAHRMRGTRAVGVLHGKTGTLSVASALSGYVTTRGYDGLVFSIVMNGAPLSTGAARAAQDQIGALLAASNLP